MDVRFWHCFPIENANQGIRQQELCLPKVEKALIRLNLLQALRGAGQAGGQGEQRGLH